MNPHVLFTKTPPLRLFFIAALPGAVSMLAVEKPVYASVISISTALVFPVLLVILLWPLALTGIWLNFAGTSLLAAVLSLWVLLRFRRERKK